MGRLTDIPAFAIPRISSDIILAFGGWCNDSPSTVIEAYDCRADRWTVLPIRDPVGERGYHGVAALKNKIYLVGGTNGLEHFKSTCCYDVGTRKFNFGGDRKKKKKKKS